MTFLGALTALAAATTTADPSASFLNKGTGLMIAAVILLGMTQRRRFRRRRPTND
ncbi:MAG: hypothetical protein U0W40_00750 [Acidimicrobiia bacterium]